MKRIAIVSACLAVGSALASRAGRGRRSRRRRRAPSVQIAILLDTSNSMDGLIGQAKTQLWNVVNEFVRAKKDGRPPGHPGRPVRVRQGVAAARARGTCGRSSR